MSCNYSEWLSPYIDDELSTLEKILLDEHLASCPECRKGLNQLKILDWDLKKQFCETEVAPEAIAACRTRALAVYFPGAGEAGAGDEAGIQNEARFSAAAFWGLQVATLKNTLTFCRHLPGSKLLNKTLSHLGKSARGSFRKRNPLLSRIIFG